MRYRKSATNTTAWLNENAEEKVRKRFKVRYKADSNTAYLSH